MKLTEKQTESLCELERRCFGESRWTRKMLEGELESPLCVLVTEEIEGVITGYAIGRTAADEGELFRIAVLPEYRRRGAARRLLERFHDEIRKRGAVCCYLEVRSRNLPAVSLYESFGYEKTAVRKNYYGDDDAFVYLLRIES